MFGIIIVNRHCYLNYTPESPNEAILKRSVELKIDILNSAFRWNILTIDEEDFM